MTKNADEEKSRPRSLLKRLQAEQDKRAAALEALLADEDAADAVEGVLAKAMDGQDPEDAGPGPVAKRASEPVDPPEDLARFEGAESGAPGQRRPDQNPPVDPHYSGQTQATTHSSLHDLAAQVFQEKNLADSLMDAEESIELKSRLTPPMVTKMAVALLMAQEHKVPQLAAVIYKLMELRVSLMGEGRKEVVEVSRGMGGMLDKDMINRMKG